MPLTSIDSLADPRLEPYQNLRHAEPALQSNCFIAEGRLVVERLLASRHRCHSVLVQQEHHPELIRQAERSKSNPLILSAPGSLIREIVGFDFHRGVLACGMQEPFGTVKGFIQAARNSPTAPTLLILSRLSIPENVGAILRTAAAFGIRHIWISGDVAYPYSRRVLRVSMACALKMHFYVSHDLEADVTELTSALGYRTIATTLSEDSTAIHDFKLDQYPLAILVGAEADGLPKNVEATCTDRVKIPMSRGIDSLNATVATSIVLYELLERPRS